MNIALAESAHKIIADMQDPHIVKTIKERLNV